MSDPLQLFVWGMRSAPRAPVVVLGAVLSFGQVACGGAEKLSAASGATATKGQRSETIDHERCDITGGNVEALDTNRDGKPDIWTVYDGSKHELCRVVDLNHDGKPDLYEYFDAGGQIRRREFCYDDTGDVNALELYEGGKLAFRKYDTTGQHKIDTWDWFDVASPVDAKTGRPAHPARRERDTRGDGNITQWWTWDGDKVTISTDRNGDGKPDPESVVVLGGEDGGAGGQTPSAPAASTGVDGGSPESSVPPSDGGSR